MFGLRINHPEKSLTYNFPKQQTAAGRKANLEGAKLGRYTLKNGAFMQETRCGHNFRA